MAVIQILSLIKSYCPDLVDCGKIYPCPWDVIQTLALIKLCSADLGGHSKKWTSLIIQTLALIEPYCADLVDYDKTWSWDII